MTTTSSVSGSDGVGVGGAAGVACATGGGLGGGGNLRAAVDVAAAWALPPTFSSTPSAPHVTANVCCAAPWLFRNAGGNVPGVLPRRLAGVVPVALSAGFSAESGDDDEASPPATATTTIAGDGVVAPSSTSPAAPGPRSRLRLGVFAVDDSASLRSFLRRPTTNAAATNASTSTNPMPPPSDATNTTVSEFSNAVCDVPNRGRGARVGRHVLGAPGASVTGSFAVDGARVDLLASGIGATEGWSVGTGVGGCGERVGRVGAVAKVVGRSVGMSVGG